MPELDMDFELELATLLSSLQADREAVASEIEVLQSIYEPGALRVWHRSPEAQQPADPNTVRYEIQLSLEAPHDDVPLRLLVSLPPEYPASHPPQLQLLSRYIGPYAVDSNLFGLILRTYIAHLDRGVEFSPDIVCVFDGVQSVLHLCQKWYEEKLSEAAALEVAREAQRGHQISLDSESSEVEQQGKPPPPLPPAGIPKDVEIFVSEPIVDRKSSFIGRACRISDPAQVPLILAHLMSDHRIARAAHPIINAWRCQVGAVMHQDNDDDGETAAGGRLAHLLQILEVNDVLVIVTRYFGGIHLGPDRFKHINQAARNALEAGGFLDGPSTDAKKHGSRKKK